MDRRTIIIGVAILILIIILGYFLFYRTEQPITNGLEPSIIPISVSQTIVPMNDNIEGYRMTEYYESDELSKSISFTVSWKNSFGFNDVTGVKLVHYVTKDGSKNEIQDKIFADGNYILSTKAGLTHTFAGTELPADISVEGDNTFEILYTTAVKDATGDIPSTATWDPITTPASITFPRVTITNKDLRIALSLLETVEYTFRPNIESFKDLEITYATGTKYWIYSDNMTAGNEYTIPYTIDTLYGDRPIIFTPSGSGVDYGTSTALNMYILMTDGEKKLIKEESDGQLSAGTSTDGITQRSDFFITNKKTTGVIVDGVFHVIKAKVDGTVDRFLFFEGGKYKFKDINDVVSESVYETMALRLNTTPVGTIDCIQNITTGTVHTTNDNGPSCGSDTLRRGERCISWTTTRKPSGGGTACTLAILDGVSFKTEMTDLPCLYEPRVSGASCKTCKNSINPTSETINYVTTSPATGNGSCNKPASYPNPCPTSDCPSCGGNWSTLKNDTTEKSRSDGCSTDLTNYPNKLVQKFYSNPENDTCKTDSRHGEVQRVPSPSCPGRDECTRKLENAPGTSSSTKCDTGKFYKWYAPNNPHNRPAEDSNCGPAGWADQGYTSSCVQALGTTVTGETWCSVIGDHTDKASGDQIKAWNASYTRGCGSGGGTSSQPTGGAALLIR